MKFTMILLALFFSSNLAVAQTDIEQITKTLVDYIEGSTEGQPDRLKGAFHKDLNLYYAKNDTLKIWSGTSYIESTKEGKPTGEAGKIISIDYENTVAVAKVEISHPKSPNTYVDYFMLLKVEGRWKIIHKAYTRRTSNKIK